MDNSFNNYQYNSCRSKGVCSINPKNSALQTVLVLYFRLFAKYAIELNKESLLEEKMQLFVLNSISASIFNLELNEEAFNSVTKVFQEKLPKIIQTYNEIFLEKNIKDESEKVNELFSNTLNINNAIKYGEKYFLNTQEKLSNEIRDLYSIILFIIKNLAINLLELYSFEQDFSKEFNLILELFNEINIPCTNLENLKKIILKASVFDTELMISLRNLQEKRYGEQEKVEVSYSTYPNKAILVVGSNVKELEVILENLKNENIDIYTHDDMIVAHTFPYFKKYPHLKGQFGQGLKNCLLDFSTFPGPIILTKNSLHNIENLYRGRLFTTDYTCPKGVIRIQNNDFTEVIESAYTAKGFKNGKQCESIELGFNLTKEFHSISKKIETGAFNKIILIGLDANSYEQKSYFNKLVKNTPKSTLVISFSYNFELDNFICLNSCFDSQNIIRVFNLLYDFNLPITIFIPQCDRNSISQLIYFSSKERAKTFVDKCLPIILNPSLVTTLQKHFSTYTLSKVKTDLEIINDN